MLNSLVAMKNHFFNSQHHHHFSVFSTPFSYSTVEAFFFSSFGKAISELNELF